jgi:hypothetical protein
LQPNSEDNGIAILWSHNEDKHPFWLSSIMRLSRDVWWDVRWKLKSDQFNYPLPGYIWNTVEKQITHKTAILTVDSKPNDERIKEVLKSWSDLKLHVNPNSPLLLYQRDRTVTCTLLKLSGLIRLRHPGQLEDTILFREKRPIGQGPQGAAIIEDPRLS